MLRDLALALCVAFLPGGGMLVELPVTLTFAVQHLGSLFAVAAVAVVYLGRAPGTSSFVTKLVGVVLLIVTLLIAGMGNFFFRELERIYDTDRLSLVARARAALASGESLSFPPPLSYIVAWDASRPADADAYRVLFTQPQQPDFDLTRLVAENRAGHLAAWSRRSTPVLAALGEEFGSALNK